MKRSKTILSGLRAATSFFSTTGDGSARKLVPQVTRSSHPLPSFLQKQLFCSKSCSFAQIIVSNNWNDELEAELDKSVSVLTHETAIHVLKKLDKNPHKALIFFNWARDKNGFNPSSPLYSLLLRILAHNKQTMKQFWTVLKQMKDEGFYLDEETYLTILASFRKENMTRDIAAMTHFYKRMIDDNALDETAKMVASLVLEDQCSSFPETKLEGMKISFSDNFVIRTMKELRNHPVKAFEFFHWAGKRSDYNHNSITYNALLRVLARKDSINDFWTAYEEMKSADFEMDIDTYIKISRQFLNKCKMTEDAVKLYELMMDGPYKPSIEDCNRILRSISGGRNPDLSLVYRIADKYEATEHSLSKSIYDGIHRSLTSLGKFDEAEDVLKAMKDAGFEPDNITHSQLVYGLCKARRLEEACEVLDDMEARGCIPDIKTWTILIQGHCDVDAVDKALICFSRMIEKNLDADADLLDVLVNGFLGQRRVDGAYQLLVGIVKQDGLIPWQETYKNVIEKLLELRKLEEAMNLLLVMKKQGYPPYPEPFVEYISKLGTVEDAMEFLKALTVKDSPSTKAYLHVLKSFFHQGRHSEAQDLLYKCPHHIRTHSQISQLFGSAKSVS